MNWARWCTRHNSKRKHGVGALTRGETSTNNRRKGKGDGDRDILERCSEHLCVAPSPSPASKSAAYYLFGLTSRSYSRLCNPCDVACCSEPISETWRPSLHRRLDVRIIPHIESILPAELKIAPTRNISRPELLWRQSKRSSQTNAKRTQRWVRYVFEGWHRR